MFNISRFEGGYNVSCHGGSDGTIEAIAVGPNGPFFYAWSNGATTSSIQNLHAGVYTVTVTDFSNNITTSNQVELFEPNAMSLILHSEFYAGGTNISELGANDGEISSFVSGGAPPYTYLWSNNAIEPNLSGLLKGIYTLTVTDATNCFASATITLTEPSQLAISNINSPLHGGYNLLCSESHDGVINLNVTGGIPPYRFLWNNGSFDQNQQHLESGHYMVRVFDANDAEVDGQITLTRPNELSLSFTKSQFQGNNNISCYSCANGNLQANVSGGVAPYAYSWRTLQTTQTITNLTAGEYLVLITDANGCKLEGGENMLQPEREDWTMGGNANTNPATQFIGTSDSVSLSFRTNNVERFKIKADGTINSSKLAGNNSGFLMADSIGNFSKQPIPNIISSVAWMVSGNNINSNNFLGSLNNVNLNFKTNSNNATGMILTTSGDLQLKKYEFESDGIFTNSAGYIDKIDFTNLSSDVLCGDKTFRSINTVSAGVWNVNGNSIYKDGNVKIGINTSNPSKTFEISHNEDHGGMVLNKTNSQNFKSQISFRQNGVEKWTLGVDLHQGNVDDFYIWKPSKGATFLIDKDGNIGIGTETPSEKLDVIGTGKFKNIQATDLSGHTGNIVILDANGGFAASLLTPNNLFQWDTHAGNISYSSGKVLIGMNSCSSCSNGIYDLYVEHGIETRDIKVTAGTFPDYVFDDKYKRLSIGEFASFIKSNKHLPGIPSAKEIENNGGFELGDLTKKLLEKTEEQALYIIDLQKQIDKLSAKIETFIKN